jgi:hypothetical protein
VADVAEDFLAAAAVDRVPGRADADRFGDVAARLDPAGLLASALVVVVPAGHGLSAGVADEVRVREADVDVGSGVGHGFLRRSVVCAAMK